MSKVIEEKSKTNKEIQQKLIQAESNIKNQETLYY